MIILDISIHKPHYIPIIGYHTLDFTYPLILHTEQTHQGSTSLHLDAFAMRYRGVTPLRKVKEEEMTDVAQATQTVTTEYNGWTNRETWIMNLWLTNDRCHYDELCDILKQFELIDEQAEQLERYVRYITDVDYVVGMTGDLLSAAISRVDWHEIASANQ